MDGGMSQTQGEKQRANEFLIRAYGRYSCTSMFRGYIVIAGFVYRRGVRSIGARYP